MLRRTPFRRKAPPQREVKTITYSPRPRAVAVADGVARMSVPVPKFGHVRDERLREMCRALECQACGAAGPDAGVTWAHSNELRHGKGKGIKASDIYVAAMCHACHCALDQGGADKAEKDATWHRAWSATVREAVARGLWPAGIPIPSTDEAA